MPDSPAPPGHSAGRDEGAKGDEAILAAAQQGRARKIAGVASHLDPLSLLFLSRSTKAFRRIFASKSSKSVWKAARRALDLPHLQATDFSEMAYASLMFEKVCSVCGKDRAGIVDFQLRKRFCNPCQKASVMVDFGVPQTHHKVVWHPYVFLCSVSTLQSAKDYHRYQPNFLVADLFPVNNELNAIQGRSKHDLPTSAAHYYGKQPFTERPDMRGGRPEFGEGEAELQAYVEAKRAWIESVKADADALERWVEDGTNRRQQEQKDGKQKRLDDIYLKIEELGYEKNDLDISDPEIKKLVDNPRPLTTSTWSRMASAVVAHISENRARRLDNERSQRTAPAKLKLRPRYDATADIFVSKGIVTAFIPFSTFVNLASVKPFWDADEPTPLTKDSWMAACRGIRKEVLLTLEIFKVSLAYPLFLALLDTPHALDPEDITDAPNGELERVFEPFKHHFTCGWCGPRERWMDRGDFVCRRVFSYQQLVEHAVSEDHDLMTFPKSGVWHVRGWAALVTRAFELIGAPEEDYCQDSDEALENVGSRRWTCEGCKDFDAELKEKNKNARYYCTDEVHVELYWYEIESHMLHFHLNASPPTTPVLGLAEEVFPPDSDDD